MTQTLTPESLQTEIQQEIAANPILVYGKGTAEAPRCGFTLETKEFQSESPIIYCFTS